MEYLAHIDNNNRGQTVKEHLEGTARLARKFAESFGNGDWGYCCGILHDVGKYSEAFQERIRGSGRPVDHATAGAQLCLEKGGLYQFISYCIAGHHAGLPDYGGPYDTGSCSTLMGRKKKKIEDYSEYQEEIKIPELTTDPFDSKETENFDFSLSMFIRMLYSCLVDADFLDTEDFMTGGETERDSGESMESLLEELESYISEWLLNSEKDTVNGRRTEILKHCLEQGVKEKGLFRLTVPTGGGKTVASLAFALKHAVSNHMERVIYVIPYTSIIEQNAQVFRRILGEENVLESHSNIDYGNSEEWKPMQLAAENWDKPVIVTTNVQFFESLFGNKSSKCRKLHNIVNSVIVFDEAQMLPADYLKPCIAAMEELLARYGASIVLCTATQPALDIFFQRNRKGTELCPRMEEQFRFFERVTFQNIGTVASENLSARLRKEKQALCIVNTRKKAQEIYRQLQGEGVYHLSTAMYPQHRKRILSKIREQLIQGEKCVLISTSLVEAGVDLDFQTVYRQLAGVDSIIQAAGRCNREGKRPPEKSIVSIFQFEEKEEVPGQRQQIDVARQMLKAGADITAPAEIEKYFSRLYHIRGESLDKKKIMEEFLNCKYNFAAVGKEFKLIENNTKTILIPREKDAEEILYQISQFGYTKNRMRRAAQYCIQVYDREFEILCGGGMVRQISPEAEDFYELTEMSEYTEEMGLNLSMETGMMRML